MMILDAIASGGQQQDALNASLHNFHSSSAALPEYLLAELNRSAQPPFANGFDRLPGTSASDVSRAIAAQVLAGTPAAVVVFQNGHWLAVTDVNLGPPKNPGGPPTLLGFFVNSPSVTPDTPPCVHSPADACASNRKYGSLEENQYVSYAAWTRDFFTGYADDSANHQFVALSGKSTASQMVDLPPPQPSPKLPHTGADIIGDSGAQQLAIDGIRRHNLAGAGKLAAAFSNVVPDSPQYVKMLYYQPGNYYLVPMMRNNTTVGVVRIDAYDETFLGAAAVKDGNIEALDFLTTAKTLLESDEYFSPDRVWHPSLESRSPFDPFHQIMKGDRISGFMTSGQHRFDKPTLLSQTWEFADVGIH